ncbi:hypothetical protein [Sphingomonas sp. BK235]|uniref:hypothetical protein n=1 Tax=Sphingomonas sp. BK235 TaxID=2512131 RepID=UPI001A9FC497|nr:hypothetical protein [Sphingomonas sp. BK235]
MPQHADGEAGDHVDAAAMGAPGLLSDVTDRVASQDQILLVSRRHVRRRGQLTVWPPIGQERVALSVELLVIDLRDLGYAPGRREMGGDIVDRLSLVDHGPAITERLLEGRTILQIVTLPG